MKSYFSLNQQWNQLKFVHNLIKGICLQRFSYAVVYEWDFILCYVFREVLTHNGGPGFGGSGG